MIKSLSKAIEILEVLKKSPKGCSLSQIYTTLDIPKSTAHGILKTLTMKMYVLKDERTHFYKLGPALVSLGKGALSVINIKNIAYLALKNLSLESGVDSFLMIPVGYKGTIIERVDGLQSIKIIENYGNEFYLHCGAMRKAILAHKEISFIDDYIENVIKKNKNLKISSVKLKEDLNKIRNEGAAVSYGEYIKGTIGIGAPIYNNKREVIASLGINFLKNKELNDEKVKVLKEIVKKKAEEVSGKMANI
ncbi:IclR family transcriptional regulator [Fusobacterium sp. IOR10]|uniref:IclR family transcriptional regulator n=1 Tax=Fusobacterium sp. IOR10 TaxID=2665157 RepID=UPI0013D403FD|nr:IclR family transcriptional regulator [Fusobacterium sp. IOR10]